MKWKCCKCSAMAVWWYAPSTSRSDAERHFCDGDDCIKRGCSCNIDPATGEEWLDEKGRRLPCCEYLWSEDGWDLETDEEGGSNEDERKEERDKETDTDDDGSAV